MKWRKRGLQPMWPGAMRLKGENGDKNFKKRASVMLTGILALSTALYGFGAYNARAAAQDSYRWRNDNGSESTATYAAAQNTPLSNLAKNTPRRLRFGFANNDNQTAFNAVNALTLGSGENNVTASAIDTVNGFAYFMTAAGIVKYDLATDTEVGSPLSPSYGGKDLQIDIGAGFLYSIGSGGIAKISLSSFTQTAFLGLTYTGPSVIDTANGFLYSGDSGGNTGRVTKVDLSTFTFVGEAATSAGNNFSGAAIDLVDGDAYFQTFTMPASIFKLDLGTFTETGSIHPTGLAGGINTLVIDTSGPTHYLYWAEWDFSAQIGKIDLSTFSTWTTILAGGSHYASATIDPAAGFAYFGTGFFSSQIDKVDINPANTFQVVDALFLGANKFQAAEIDETNGNLYFGTGESPALVYKIVTTLQPRLQIEYGRTTSTCAAAGFTAVGPPGGSQEWTMSPSANIADGAATTDSGGLSNGASTFVAGEIHDTASVTAPILLPNDDFTEVEYSIVATNHAVDGGDYCFRVTDAGSTAGFTYSNYAEATLPGPTQNGYLWKNDDGSESAATPVSTENDPLASVDIGETERLRFGLTGPIGGTPNTIADRIPVGSGPSGIAITPDGAYAYVANQDGTVSVIRISDDTVTDTVSVGSGPYDIAITPDGQHAYVTNQGDGTVSVIDTSTDTVIDTVSVGSTPWDIAITPNGAFAYVVNLDDNDVSVIDTSINSVVDTVSVGGVPRGIAITPDGAFAYVTNGAPDNVSVIDTSVNAVVDTVSVGNNPWAVAITPDGAYAYVVNQSGSDVSVIEIATDNVVDSVGVVGNPDSIAITPDGTYAYVGNGSDGDVSVIETSSNTVVDTVNVDSGASGGIAITPDSAYAYVGNYFASSVTVISIGPGSFVRLEYAVNPSTCDAASSWTRVGNAAGSEDWIMSDSTYLTDAQATTDDADLSDPAGSFVAGQAKDVSSQTSNITLTASQFTEIEYSIKPNSTASYGTAYCFRMADPGGDSALAYVHYAEATTQAAPPPTEQNAYRWRNDDGSETTATFAAAENAPLADVVKDTTERLRLGLTGPLGRTFEESNATELGNSEADRTIASVIDTDNGFVYYGTQDSPAKVVKVRTSDNAEIDSIDLDINNINSAVIDTANGFAYFGSDESPAKIAKVDLSSFTQVGSALPLNSGENRARSAVIDTANGFAYFGLFGASGAGKVAKIDLSAFTEVGSALGFNSGENHPRTAVIDTTNGFAYFGTLGSSCGAGGCGTDTYVVKVNLTSFTEVGTGLGLEGSGMSNLRNGVIDGGNGFAYFGDQSGNIAKIDLSGFTFDSSLAVTDNFYLASSVIDTTDGFAYFGTNSSPARVYQIDLSTFTENTFITFGSGESFAYAASIDVGGGFAYFGTQQNFAKSIMVQLPSASNVRLEYGEKTSTCAAIATWTQVGAPAGPEDWIMSNSSNLTDGEATTDNAGLSDGAATFVAGQAKDVSSETAPLAFPYGDFTELEYSIKANTTDVDGTEYCFRLTDSGDDSNFTYTRYAEASLEGGGGGSTTPTGDNRVVQSRLKIGESSTADVYFTLADTLDGTLTVTFPADYTVTGAPTSGTCQTGTIDTFAFNGPARTFTAEKHGCSGDVALLGGTVVNPATPGPKLVSWVNDDPGFAIVAITGDDQIMVTAAVNAFITFQVTTDHTGANADCSHGTDAGSGDHTPSTDGGVVQLGLLDPTSVASSDAARNGAATDDGDSDASPVTAGTDVQHICTFVSTNAGGGYALTVASENGALGSDSTPADTIPATPVTGAPASVLVTPGTERYTMCLSTSDAPSMDATTPAGSNLTASGAYLSGTCTGSNASQTAGELSTQTTEIGSNAGAVQEGTAQWLIKSSISSATKAHADYDDTLTFIATGSF